ncbi:hypothetical protein BGZ61DRAFT_539025 [Ilyonectria robusta]|uniref:uncharacterized protein n=1 Tax=Ilyonectria robusta TaxID=1079257 RepID=UPI001E8CFBF5|nr:uncharacterized protein BGZ61DRAFT_539025 [Ilyonectria robusta]KAH8664954.1 hypothetical protein BGZ61DRAFT_539025 [Ilyonectria robusta]
MRVPGTLRSAASGINRPVRDLEATPGGQTQINNPQFREGARGFVGDDDAVEDEDGDDRNNDGDTDNDTDMASPIRFVFAGDGYGDDDDVLGVEDKGHSEDHASELGVLEQDEDVDMNYDEEVDEDVDADADEVADEITDEEDDEYGKKDVEKDVNENGEKDVDVNNIIVVEDDDDDDVIMIEPPSLDNNIEALLGYPAITPRSSTTNEPQRDLLQLNVEDLGINHLNDDQASWKEACRFFLHDEADTGTGVLLPGFQRVCYNYQMLDVFKMLQPCASMQQNGTLNCSKPGMGKTLEALLTAGVIALAHMSEDHYRQNVASHRSMNVDDERCLLDHPFGIMCYCIRDSFTRDICRMTQRAPHFVVTKAGIVQQWINEGSSWLSPVVILRDGSEYLSESLLFMASITNRTVKWEGRHGRTMSKVGASAFLDQCFTTGKLPSRGDVLKFNKMTPAEARAVGDEAVFTWSMTEASKMDKDFKCKVKETPFIHVGAEAVARERLVLVCSAPAVSGGVLDNLFVRKLDVVGHNIKSSRRITIRPCFRPSTLYYDEWVDAKNKDTNLVNTFKDICNVDHLGRIDRPLVCLLSATPMPCGPKDLVGVFPLLTVDPDVYQTMSDLIRIYKKAFNCTSRSHKGGENPELVSNKGGGEERSNWFNAAGDILGKYMFHRNFSIKFLDTVIEDRRTSVKIYPPRFCNNPSSQPRREAEMRQAIREKVKSMEKVKIKSSQFEAICRSHEFQKMLRCSVIPGLLNLNAEDWELIFSEDKDTADGAIYWNLQALKCEQLTILQRLIKSSDHGKHGIILAFSPLVVSIAAAWLSRYLGDGFRIVKLRPMIRSQ